MADSIIIKAGHGIMTIPRKKHPANKETDPQTEKKQQHKSVLFDALEDDSKSQENNSTISNPEWTKTKQQPCFPTSCFINKIMANKKTWVNRFRFIQDFLFPLSCILQTNNMRNSASIVLKSAAIFESRPPSIAKTSHQPTPIQNPNHHTCLSIIAIWRTLPAPP